MEFILMEIKDRIAYIVLNRPEKRNALSFELVKELKAALTLAENNPEVKVIVLKANGSVFCAGADLAYLQKLQEFSYEENLIDSRNLKELFEKIFYLSKIVIAQIHGHAIAGGCGLATICDFSFAVPEAKFGYTEVNIGFAPALVSIFLTRKIGEGRARQMLLSGNLIEAEIAREWGLINWVVPKDQLEQKVNEFALALCQKNSGESMAYTKKILAALPSMGIKDALEYAAKINAKARSGKECKKGIAAFLNKEPINW